MSKTTKLPNDIKELYQLKRKIKNKLSKYKAELSRVEERIENVINESHPKIFKDE